VKPNSVSLGVNNEAIKTMCIRITSIIYDTFAILSFYFSVWDLSNHNLNFMFDLIDGVEEKGWKFLSCRQTLEASTCLAVGQHKCFAIYNQQTSQKIE
jgi:hypothetical protein